MKKTFTAILLLLLSCSVSWSQMTRSQLLKKFYQITTLHESGDDAQAISICEEIAAVYPKLPDTYLRMAQIYDDAGELELALVMYRQYTNLEMDDSKIAGCSERLKQLEDKFDVQSMESHEEELLKTVIETAELPSQPTRHAPSTINTTVGGNITSLFDLSALVQTAVDEEPAVDASSPELAGKVSGLEVQWQESEQIRHISLSKPISAPDNVLAEETADTASEELVEQIFNNASQLDATADCDVPFLFKPHPDLLERYHLARETGLGSKPSMQTSFGDKGSLSGRWVSSKSDPDTGLEYAIFDFQIVGANLNVTFNKNSGIFHDGKKRLLSASWNAIRNIWATDGKSFNPDILKDNTRPCTIRDNMLSFDFSLEKKNIPDWVSMGKSVVDGVLAVLPFGAVASKLSDSFLNQSTRKATFYQTFLNFNFQSVTADVMLCTLTITEKQTGGTKDKELLLDETKFYMYRVPDNYEYFKFEDEANREAVYYGIYSKLQNESAGNPALLYPLSYMSYYGIGMNYDFSDSYRLSKAIQQMQSLADKEQCNRARAWLVSVCYNLSLDEEHYPLRAQRKHFRDYAQQQLGMMLADGSAYANALQGDILASEGDNPEKAFDYYRRGAEMSDPYSIFCMGKAYADGQLVQKDDRLALEYFQKAADAGYADAWLQIALIYKNGRGVQSSYDEYIRCLYKAIDAGSSEALSELSLAYFWGIGVKRNTDAAFTAKRAYQAAKANIWKDVLDLYGYSFN